MIQSETEMFVPMLTHPHSTEEAKHDSDSDPLHVCRHVQVTCGKVAGVTWGGVFVQRHLNE